MCKGSKDIIKKLYWWINHKFFLIHLSTSKKLAGIHDLLLQKPNSTVSKHWRQGGPYVRYAYKICDMRYAICVYISACATTTTESHTNTPSHNIILTIMIILGDFNLKPIDSLMMTFLNELDSINLIKNNTCFKAGLCIDMILTNRKFLFENSTSFETSFTL